MAGKELRERKAPAAPAPKTKPAAKGGVTKTAAKAAPKAAKTRPEAVPGECTQVAYLPEGMTMNDTTHEVDYLKIYNRYECEWFMKGVSDLQCNECAFPATSHAFDTKMADLHRRHPRIAFGYLNEETDKVDAFEMVVYESAGLWKDDTGEVCMPVQASFEDGVCEMLLLYKSNMVPSMAAMRRECQWCEIPKNAPTSAGCAAMRKELAAKAAKSAKGKAKK